MKFVIYSRKSINSERGKSVENQIEMCKKYINDKFKYIDEKDIIIFEDKGLSGKNTNRQGFLDMMNYINTSKVDFLICYKLDRISRSISDFSNFIEMLNCKKIGFISIKEEFDTSKPMGKAMLYIASIFSQLERETISERVKDNMHMLAREGYWLGGNLPTGYRSILVYENGKKHYKLEIFNEEIEKVKIIYKKMLELKSVSKIEKYLKENNIKTREGNFFSNIAIREILKNPVYCIYDKDIFLYFKEKGADIFYDEKNFNKGFGLSVYNKRSYQNKVVKNKEKDFIISLGDHKGIIKGKDFSYIQGFFKDKKVHKPHNEIALFSGKIICSRCNEKMIFKAHSNIDKNGSYYYICKNKMYNGKEFCSIKNINGKKLDYQILKILEEDYFFNEKEHCENINKKIEKYSKHIDSLMDNVINYPYDKNFNKKTMEKIESLKKQIENLQKEKLKDIKIGSLSIYEKRRLANKKIKRITWDGENYNLEFL